MATFFEILILVTVAGICLTLNKKSTPAEQSLNTSVKWEEYAEHPIVEEVLRRIRIPSKDGYTTKEFFNRTYEPRNLEFGFWITSDSVYFIPYPSYTSSYTSYLLHEKIKFRDKGYYPVTDSQKLEALTLAIHNNIIEKCNSLIDTSSKDFVEFTYKRGVWVNNKLEGRGYFYCITVKGIGYTEL